MSVGISLSVVGIIARQELRIALRNRWIVAYAAIFAVLTMAISYFGLTLIEFTGFQGFQRTTASLLNLMLYIVPLVSMLMAVQSFSIDGGTTDQLFTEPVTRSEIVLGKLGGMVGANVLATLFGFGFSGLIIARNVGTKGLASYLILVGFTILTGMVFAGIATWLSILMRRTVRAYALVLVTWFVLVLLFDLLVIGLNFLLPERAANHLAFTAVFFNPIDAARVGTLLATSGKEMFGLAGALLTRSVGGVGQATALLCASLVAWIVTSSVAAIIQLNRQDI